MRIGGFGFGLPHGLFSALGLAVEDTTLVEGVACEAIAGFIEPFMDPFAASVLHRLAGGSLNHYSALIFLRESPGAIPAFHYACEFERRGLLPADSPQLILFNLIPAASDAARQFNDREIARLIGELDRIGWRPGSRDILAAGEVHARLLSAQSDGRVRAADTFELRAAIIGGRQAPADELKASQARSGRRTALLGAPLGNSLLHAILEEHSLLALDQQGLDLAWAVQGHDRQSALAAYTTNPFAARQPADLYMDAVEQLLAEHRIERVVWQVDRHDDLWGWLMPDIRALTNKLGVGFVDLGFLPRWPRMNDLEPVARQLGAMP